MKPYLEQQRPHNVIVLGKSLTDIVGKENVQAFADEIQFHGTLYHPSVRGKKGKTYVGEMDTLRRLANGATSVGV